LIDSHFFFFEIKKKKFNFACPRAELLIDLFLLSLPILTDSPVQGGQQTWQKWPLRGKALQTLLVTQRRRRAWITKIFLHSSD
jgi:hypothetical protein